MKKLALFCAALVCAIFMSTVTAATSQLFKGTDPTFDSLGMHNTDITVINTTNTFIYAYAFNGAVYDQIQSGYNDHIWDNTFGSTYISILNPDRYSITTGPILACRYAILTVYGYYNNPGDNRYSVNYDDELCR